MKKIVMVRSNPVDPDSRVEKEANSLIKAGYHVQLVVWDRQKNYCVRKDDKALGNGCIPRVRFGAKAAYGAGMKSLISFLRFQISLFIWLIIHSRDYDVCHFCDFDTAFTGSLVCKLTKKKFVFDIFDYLSTDAKSRGQLMIKKLEDGVINHAAATIICTEDRKRQIKDAHPQKLVIIHNTPVDTGKKPIDENDKPHKIKVAYVGILQDHRLLIEIGEYFTENQNIELHIGGFGKFESYFEKLSKENDNIFYYGRLEYEKTIQLEQRCDIMLAIYDPEIGNHKFAAPNKFYESLMLGKPVIMVKNTGMSQIVEENDIGVLIEYSEQGFIEGIRTLVSRQNEWPYMKQRMRKLYNENFNWETMEERLVELYNSL